MDELNNNNSELNPQENTQPQQDANQMPYADLNNTPYQQPPQNDNIYYGDPNQQQQNYNAPYNLNYYEDQNNKPKGSKGMAIASLVLGILSIVTCCIYYISLPCAIVSIIFSIICLVKKKEGKGMAIAGLICSIVGLVLFAAFYIYIFAVLGVVADYYGLSVPELLQEIQNGNITSDDIAQVAQEIAANAQ